MFKSELPSFYVASFLNKLNIVIKTMNAILALVQINNIFNIAKTIEKLFCDLLVAYRIDINRTTLSY